MGSIGLAEEATNEVVGHRQLMHLGTVRGPGETADNTRRSPDA